MSDKERQHAMSMLTRLYTQPLSVLEEKALHVLALSNNDTQSVKLYFAVNHNEIRISPRRDVAIVFPGLEEIPDAVVPCSGFSSAMRGPIESRKDRLSATSRLDPRGEKLWVTDRQTGCSVLILKWPDRLYSMIHLQPSQDSEFNRLGAFINKSDIGTAVQKNSWLKNELTKIAEQSGNGRSPEEYILVQSVYAITRGVQYQVIGVKSDDAFEFFLQKIADSRKGPIVTAQKLVWTTWRWYLPYFCY